MDYRQGRWMRVMLKKSVEIPEPGHKLMALCPSRPGSLLYEAKQSLKVIGSKYHEHFLVYLRVAAVAGAPQAMVLFALAKCPLRPNPSSPHIPLGSRPLHPLGKELFIGLILGDMELPAFCPGASLFSGAAAAIAGPGLVNPLPLAQIPGVAPEGEPPPLGAGIVVALMVIFEAGDGID